MERNVRIAIIGGGPAGTGTILKAMKDGRFEEMVAGGLAVIESSSTLIEGSITKYNVNSDTLSDVFLECLEGETGRYLDLGLLHEEIETVRQFHGRSIPLPALQPFLRKLGDLLLGYLQQHPQCTVHINTRATAMQRRPNNSIAIACSSNIAIEAENVILSTGATASSCTHFAGEVDLLPYQHKSITSDQLIASVHDATTKKLLAELPESPDIVILGGNHSAFSAADYLLKQKQWNFKNGSISIWSTHAPKIFFSSQEEAIRHNYTDFTHDDICKLTNRVYRLAGLRMDGRALYMKMQQMNGAQEKRAALHFYSKNSQMESQLQSAGLVVNALGYGFNVLPFHDSEGRVITIRNNNGHWVNNNCQLIGTDDQPIPGLFAVGLGTGFIPSGKLGGESGFTGQTNGLWYYQNATAELLLEHLLN